MERTKRTWQWVAYSWYSRIGRLRPVEPGTTVVGSRIPGSSEPPSTILGDDACDDGLRRQLEQASLPIRCLGDPRDIYLA